jgi:hypothetical protein
MSKFVNYKKRSVKLPPGCKDLIDLLQPHRPSPAHGIIPANEKPSVTRGESGTVKLADIEKFVAMPFQSRAQTSLLMLSLPDERFTFDVAHMKGEFMFASAKFEEDAERERLMREFFVAHGLEQPREDWTPAQFIPDVPVQFIYRISPLPSDAAAASQLAADLFRHVCGLSDDSQLTFLYYEV